MKCKKAQKLLIAYLDNELSTRKQNTVQSHLVQCPVCSAELESYKKLNGIINQFPKLEDRSPLYWQNQIHAIEQKVAEIDSGKKPEPVVQFRWHQPVWGKLATASATISVVAIILFITIYHQPAKTILLKDKGQTMILAEKPAAVVTKNIDEEKVLQPTRARKPAAPSAPISPTHEMMKKDITTRGELEYAMADKISPKEAKEITPPLKAERVAGGALNREIAAVQVPAAPSIEEPKLAKGTYPISKAKTAGSYAFSTIPDEKAGEFRAKQVAIAGDILSQSMGLARGTAVFFTGQQAEQVALYDHGTITPAKPLAVQSADELNLGLDSARVRMIQEAMEMMIKTSSPGQQNQRMIEIREMPQTGVSSTRHLQIKMEFQP